MIYELFHFLLKTFTQVPMWKMLNGSIQLRKTIHWHREDLYFQIAPKNVQVHVGEHVNCQSELSENLIN